MDGAGAAADNRRVDPRKQCQNPAHGHASNLAVRQMNASGRLLYTAFSAEARDAASRNSYLSSQKAMLPSEASYCDCPTRNYQHWLLPSPEQLDRPSSSWSSGASG